MLKNLLDELPHHRTVKVYTVHYSPQKITAPARVQSDKTEILFIDVNQFMYCLSAYICVGMRSTNWRKHVSEQIVSINLEYILRKKM